MRLPWDVRRDGQTVTDPVPLRFAGRLREGHEGGKRVQLAVAGRVFDGDQVTRLQATVLKAYRGQYIVSGVQDPRFVGILREMVTEAQMQRIGAALAPIIG